MNPAGKSNYPAKSPIQSTNSNLFKLLRCPSGAAHALRQAARVRIFDRQKSTLDAYQERYPERDQAMAQAYLCAYTMAEIGRQFAVHYMTVNRAVRKIERERGGTV